MFILKFINQIKEDKKLLAIIKIFKNKEVPILPFRASMLMTKYNIPEGKKLGLKMKMIEELWVKNNFQLSEKVIEKIVNN